MAQPRSKRGNGTSRGGEKTRRRILRAALRMFSKDGFRGTSIRELARAAGLSEAALYHHFPSKKAIVAALYEERGYMESFQRLEQVPAHLPMERQLVANVMACARIWDDDIHFQRMILSQILRGDKAAQAIHQELMDRYRRGIHDLLSKHRDKGTLPPYTEAEITEISVLWVNGMFGAFVDRLLSLNRARIGRGSFLSSDFAAELERAALVFARAFR